MVDSSVRPARIVDPAAPACPLRTRGLHRTTGVIRTLGDERRRIVDRPIVVGTLDELADDRIGLLVTLRTQLRQQEQAHDGRFIATELVPKRITPHFDGR